MNLIKIYLSDVCSLPCVVSIFSLKKLIKMSSKYSKHKTEYKGGRGELSTITLKIEIINSQAHNVIQFEMLDLNT